LKPDTIVKLRDAFTMAADALQSELEASAPQDLINIDAITWETLQGERGPYQKSDDFNNPEFKRLHKALNEHNGKMRINNFFIWTFQNGVSIGRKPKT